MKTLSFIVVILLLNNSLLFSQVAINTGGASPDNSAMLDVNSTTKGMLIPRMTLAERDGIINPANGLLIFCTGDNQYYSNKGTPSVHNWVMVSSQWLFTGSDIYFSGGNVGLSKSNPAYPLDVLGDINFSGTLRKNGTTVATGVSTVTATIPLTSSGGASPNISIPQASSVSNGFLSFTDWNTFNNKQNALTFGNLTSGDMTITGGTGAVIGSGTTMTVNKGNLTEATSSVLTITGGTGSVLGTGASIQVKPANTSQSGYLSSANWNSFNNKVSSQWVTNGLDISYNTGKVGIGTSTLSSSAVLEVASISGGVLLPRISLDQRNAITGPAEGLMVFCTDCGSNGAFSVYSNGSWMTFNLCFSAASAAGSNIVTPGQIIWNWTAVSGATGYKWSTGASYGTAVDMGTATSRTETGIVCNSTYTRYVWAYNTCGVSVSTTLSQAIAAAAPVIPTAGTHVPTLTSIVWNWNAITDAIGYKWNTTDDYETATDMGTDTTKTETGLPTYGTVYTRYVWAYNGCGISPPGSLTQATLSFTCSDSITIYHLASEGVAPVDKTVTYGTVTNIPGETSKCWITSNLGADHQATAKDDATEPSAGWYWQFNRMQGYKHTGTTRTPNTTWITPINEAFDWQPANDPCNLEHGNGWRIPTSTEWTHVDASGNWNEWTGPWTSALKMHAAGALHYTNGLLESRGSVGLYASSLRANNTFAWDLYFLNNNCFVYNGNLKTYGFSLRCIRD